MAFDTKTIVLHQDELDFLGDNEFGWSFADVEAVVKKAFDQTAVGEQTNFRAFGVSEIVAGNSYSKVAFVETDSGYFTISASMLEHIIVTFARWD